MAGTKQQTAKRTGTAHPIGQKKAGRPSIGGKISRKTFGTPKKKAQGRRAEGQDPHYAITPRSASRTDYFENYH